MTDFFYRELFIDMCVDVLNDLVQQFAFKTLLHGRTAYWGILIKVELQDQDDDLFEIAKHELIIVHVFKIAHFDEIVECRIDFLMCLIDTVCQ